MTTPTPLPRPIPLSQLPHGTWGVVREQCLDEETCELLRTMGMAESCPLRVCRNGRTCIVETTSTRLALTRDLSSRILVDAIVDADDAA